MQQEKTDTAAVVAAIERGEVSTAKVVEAVRKVIERGQAVIEWEFNAGSIDVLREAGLGGTITPDSLTIGEQVAIIDATDVGWDSFDPRNDQRYAQAMLVAVVTSRCPDHDAAKAKALVDKVTTGEFDAAYQIVEKRPAGPS